MLVCLFLCVLLLCGLLFMFNVGLVCLFVCLFI